MKTDYPYPILAREGWPFLLLFLAIAIVLQIFLTGWWLVFAALFYLLFLFSLQFFRDPRRPLPDLSSQSVLCPADGRVIAIEQVEDPYLSRPALKVSIFMNVFDVHVNRMPVSGLVQNVWYFPGRFFNAALDKASLENERNALWIKTPDGQDVTVVQVAGLVARRIVCHVRKGNDVGIGQRFGFIRFGSRVDTYLPLDTQVQVRIGERVRSGAQCLATLPVTAP
ncbi:phosphatidylserine decarboxylase [Acidithiobacillus marinus]|uniref:Phosphatidylserine decarboxylase proenzyme n=1 Tax=Acidithiobacillus marinus TaxID=187490 RepID=A0A2I1DNJ6_9PROT|nr:phosphatidylserine decarboxylase [Acidithiobacillus marinus]PKY11448.1 phosphatidylserine decarboxylase [Acidithiobacillus marinus]